MSVMTEKLHMPVELHTFMHIFDTVVFAVFNNHYAGLEVQVKLHLKSFHSYCTDFTPPLASQDPEFEPESFSSLVVCEKPNNNLNHFKCYA